MKNRISMNTFQIEIINKFLSISKVRLESIWVKMKSRLWLETTIALEASDSARENKKSNIECILFSLPTRLYKHVGMFALVATDKLKITYYLSVLHSLPLPWSFFHWHYHIPKQGISRVLYSLIFAIILFHDKWLWKWFR